MNICKNCKHYSEGLCAATAINLVTGEANMNSDSCYVARKIDGRCGLEGRLFEAIPVSEPKAPTRKKATKAPEETPKESTDGES